MTYSTRVYLAKEDISRLNIFHDEELKEIQNDTYFIVFESDEFYQIFYLTNTDLYYVDKEDEEWLNTADNILDTDQGRIYCFR